MDLFGLIFAFVLIGAILLFIREPFLRFLFEPKWDYFVSHSSKDKDIINPLVEILSSKNYRVWIDSSEIKEQDPWTNRRHFRRPISVGIQKSSFALLFTSKNFCESSYCIEEATFFIKRFADHPQHIIEIQLDQNKAHQILRLSPKSTFVDFSKFRTDWDENRYMALAELIGSIKFRVDNFKESEVAKKS